MTKDWIAFFLFVVLFTASMVGETLWLTRKGWASGGRSVAYVLITDVLSFGIGIFVYFVTALIMLMLVFGPAGAGPSTGSEPAMWFVVAVAVIFPPIVLFLFKRIFLAILKIQTGRRAWIYSLAATFLIAAVVLVPPALFFYFA